MAITAVPLHENMKTYTMKQACELTGMNYEALKFYCNSGLVPGLKRDQNNRRVFDERCIAWINGLTCLKRCGLGKMCIRDSDQDLARLVNKGTITFEDALVKVQVREEFEKLCGARSSF